MKDIKENIIRLFYIILTVISIYSIMSIDISSGQADDYAKKPHKWGTFPVIYIEPFDANDKTKSVQFKGAVEDALRQWVDNSAVVWILDKEDNDNRANVVVKWIDDSVIPARISGDTDSVGYASVTFNNNGIVTGPNTVYIIKKNPDNSEISWRVASDIALHEFGHIFGLGHSEVENDVMNKTIVIERNGIYESNRAISTRDKTMLNDVFKGFAWNINFNQNNQIEYSITSLLGDLNNVDVSYYCEILYKDNAIDPITPMRNKQDPFTINILKKDIPDMYQYSVGNVLTIKDIKAKFFVKDAVLPNVKNAKFIGNKEYEKEFPLGTKCNYCHTIDITECIENTQPGHNIMVTSLGTDITYDTVMTCGTTNISEISGIDTIGNYETYAVYDIGTTSLYSGDINIKISYSDISTDNGKSLRLLHNEGEDWVDITTNIDTSSRIITGKVHSLSLFAIIGKPTIIITGGADLLYIIMTTIILIYISILSIKSRKR